MRCPRVGTAHSRRQGHGAWGPRDRQPQSQDTAQVPEDPGHTGHKGHTGYRGPRRPGAVTHLIRHFESPQQCHDLLLEVLLLRDNRDRLRTQGGSPPRRIRSRVTGRPGPPQRLTHSWGWAQTQGEGRAGSISLQGLRVSKAAGSSQGPTWPQQHPAASPQWAGKVGLSGEPEPHYPAWPWVSKAGASRPRPPQGVSPERSPTQPCTGIRALDPEARLPEGLARSPCHTGTRPGSAGRGAGAPGAELASHGIRGCQCAAQAAPVHTGQLSSGNSRRALCPVVGIL